MWFFLFVLLQLLDRLKFYARFEISDESGDPLTERDMTAIHYSRITSLQVGSDVSDLRYHTFELHVISFQIRDCLVVVTQWQA